MKQLSAPSLEMEHGPVRVQVFGKKIDIFFREGIS
jgi:hypothetical protein